MTGFSPYFTAHVYRRPGKVAKLMDWLSRHESDHDSNTKNYVE